MAQLLFQIRRGYISLQGGKGVNNRNIILLASRSATYWGGGGVLSVFSSVSLSVYMLSVCMYVRPSVCLSVCSSLMNKNKKNTPNVCPEV